MPPADSHNTNGEFNPAFHSTTGMTSVSLPGFPLSIDSRVLQASQELAQGFPFIEDYNGGKPIGLGKIKEYPLKSVHFPYLYAYSVASIYDWRWNTKQCRNFISIHAFHFSSEFGRRFEHSGYACINHSNKRDVDHKDC